MLYSPHLHIGRHGYILNMYTMLIR